LPAQTPAVDFKKSHGPGPHIARRNNLPWYAILGPRSPRAISRSRRVYLATCEAINLERVPHSGDLAAPQALGLKTGHIGRPGAPEMGLIVRY
jgi:hypothetical protein